MVTYAQNNAANFSAALALFSVTVSDAQALQTTLTNVCNHTLAASLTDDPSIITEANFILANVPTFARIF
jgi:hypothetical protein